MTGAMARHAESLIARGREAVAAFRWSQAREAFQQALNYWDEPALWLPPSQEPDEQRLAELVQRSVPEDKQHVVFDIMEQMATFHPTEPCWYLPLVRVDPTYQRRGLGSALLQSVLAECDRQNPNAYREATSPKNLALYEHHGFTSVGTICAGDAPPMTPMIREARA